MRVKGQGLSHSLYDRLIAVLDVFINEFGGQRRLRGVQTMLLIQRATFDGGGVSISDVRKLTGAPLENIRRHFARQVESGMLATQPDPEDDRVVRYRMVDDEQHRSAARTLSAKLLRLAPAGIDPPSEPRPLSGATYSTMIDVLQTFANSMDGGLRIRAFKIAVVIQQATKAGTGMTASEIARQSGAPLETVRRYIQSYLDIGNLRAVEDPEDSRKTRVHYADPAMVDEVLERIAADLDKLDWASFKLS